MENKSHREALIEQCAFGMCNKTILGIKDYGSEQKVMPKRNSPQMNIGKHRRNQDENLSCASVDKNITFYSLPKSFQSNKDNCEANFVKEEIKIREANESEADALALLVAERGFDYPTETSLVRERLNDLIRAGDCILVAVYNSNVIGMALLHSTRFLHRPPDGRIVSLVISEIYRSRGVGACLIEAAESVFRSLSCGRVEVTSGAAREAAHRFYVRAGYSEHPKRFIKIL